MNHEREILRNESEKAILKLEAAFLKAMTVSGKSQTSSLGHYLGLPDLIGGDHGSDLARAIARSLEKKGYVKIIFGEYWRVERR